MTTEYSTALPSNLHLEAAAHLVRSDGQEDLCFAIWYPSRGTFRKTALLYQLILPRDGERHVHGNVSFSSAYFERAIAEAVAAEGGLAFLHSHPAPGWQDMSSDDVRAEQGHAAAAKGATGLPLIGLTIGNDGAWSSRFWEKAGPRKYERRWCTNVRVVGDLFDVTFADRLLPKPQFKERLRRTISSWGEEAQANLARLRIGIVGAGSVGALVAETLARTGIRQVTLIDFDTVEEVNLDRLLHATTETASKSESKVRSLAQGISLGATADKFSVLEIDRSIAEEEGYRAALDCDILFSCVDRPWGRSVLNFIAYAHLIPVIDGGIHIEVTSKKTLRRADWKAHIAAPNQRCLECLDQFNAGLVQAEREGWLDDPEYIKNLPETDPIKRNENVIAFSMSLASVEVLQMLMMIVKPLGVHDLGAQRYHFVPGLWEEPRFEACKPSCLYPSLTSRGDTTGLVVTGPHKKAEETRARRSNVSQQSRFRRIQDWWRRLAGSWRTGPMR